jgi:hypothetical protein
MNAHITAGKTKLDDVKDALKAELQKRKLEETRANLDKRLRKAAKVEEL